MNFNLKNISKNYLNAIAVIFINIVALVVVVFIPFLTVDSTDNPYQARIANHYIHTGEFVEKLTFFGQFVLSKIILFFGDKLLYLKLFNSLLVFINILLPLLFFYKSINYKKYLFYASIVVLVYVPFARLSIGWDAVSDIFINLTAISFIKYITSNSKKWFLLGAIFAVFAIYTKVTNLALLMLLFAFYVYYQNFKVSLKTIKKSTVFLLLFVFLFLLLLFLFFPSPLHYFFNYNAGRDYNNSYSLFGLIERIFNHLKFALKPLLLIFVFDYVFNISKFKSNKIIKAIVIIGAILGFLHFVKIERNFYLYSIVVNTFLCYIFIKSIVKEKFSSSNTFYILFFIGISFIPIVGSNTGLIKANFIIYIPFLILWLKNETVFKNYKVLLLLFFCYAFVLRMVYFVDMQPITTEKVVNSNKLYPIISTKTTNLQLAEIDAVVKINQNKNIYFYGLNSHIYDYLYDIHQPIFASFDRDFNSKKDIDLFIEDTKYKNDVILIIIKLYPDEINLFKQSLFYKKLIQSNYKITNHQNYIIFERG